jgi:hypothetical protein
MTSYGAGNVERVHSGETVVRGKFLGLGNDGVTGWDKIRVVEESICVRNRAEIT